VQSDGSEEGPPPSVLKAHATRWNCADSKLPANTEAGVGLIVVTHTTRSRSFPWLVTS
jgi:hypothetical protein